MDFTVAASKTTNTLSDSENWTKHSFLSLLFSRSADGVLDPSASKTSIDSVAQSWSESDFCLPPWTHPERTRMKTRESETNNNLEFIIIYSIVLILFIICKIKEPVSIFILHSILDAMEPNIYLSILYYYNNKELTRMEQKSNLI